MKIIFDKAELITAVSPAMGSVSNKNTLAPIEGILIESEGSDCCVLSAYDLEKGMRITLPAIVEEGGSFIINAAKLNQMIRIMPESRITIEVDRRGIAKISSGKTSFELHALRGEDFPNLPELSVDGGIPIKQKELKDMITSTMFAVAQNNQRSELNGAFFRIDDKQLTVVACDSNRLAIKSKKLELVLSEELNRRFIIPGKTLSELVRLLDSPEETMIVKPMRKHCVFKIRELYFFTRLIEQEYIDYDRFIPKNSKIFVTLDDDAFADSLERALLVTDDKNVGQTRSTLKCTFVDDRLELTSASVSSSFFDELPIEMEGEGIVIGFNCRNLLEAVKSCGVERIRLAMSSPLMSMTIAPAEKEDEGSFLFLVLPVKMKD